MAIALILFSPMADGRIALGQVYHAIAKVRNVCISRFVPGKKDPTRVEYVSKTLKSKLFVLQDRIVLRDLQNMVTKIKDRESGEITTMPVPPERLTEFTEGLEGTFGLVPFPDITDVPEDAQWTRVPDDQIEDITPGTVVYDLTWIEDGRWGHKRRFFIHAQTHLPEKVERYWKLPGEGKYTFDSSKIVRYVSEGEIEALIWGTFE
jgi:hypothetical protein